MLFLSVGNLELTAEQVAETRGFRVSSYIEPRASRRPRRTSDLPLLCASVISFLALYPSRTGC